MNHLIPINERKVKQKRRFDQKSKTEIIAEKSDEKGKTDERLKNGRSLTEKKPTNAFVETNGSVNARKITKP